MEAFILIAIALTLVAIGAALTVFIATRLPLPVLLSAQHGRFANLEAAKLPSSNDSGNGIRANGQSLWEPKLNLG